MPHDLLPIATATRRRNESNPAISVIGLGYVGAVSAACFADLGHRVIGVDLDPVKIASIADGRAPLVEPGLGELMARGAGSGRLDAIASIAAAVQVTDITFICVGTPSREDGSVDLGALRIVAREIGRAIADKSSYHLVVVRSTVPVGTTRNLVLPILESESGRSCGETFGLCFHPEFLREGVAIADFFAPPKTVVGGIDAASAEMLARIYAQIDAPLIRSTVEVAEMVKYVDNTWHAVKVAFANEIGKVCQSVQLDSHDVMDIFVRDQKLNLSPYYLRPGFAFGGSCLPKDVRAINGLAEANGVDIPLIGSLLRSNDAQIEHAVELVLRSGATRIGVLGVTFKKGTDDLRESPQLDLIGRLIDRGLEVRAFDPNVTPEGLRLAEVHAKTASMTARFALQALPTLLETSAERLVAWSELVIASHNTTEFADAIETRTAGTQLLDLVRLPQPLRSDAAYSGICW